MVIVDDKVKILDEVSNTQETLFQNIVKLMKVLDNEKHDIVARTMIDAIKKQIDENYRKFKETNKIIHSSSIGKKYDGHRFDIIKSDGKIELGLCSDSGKDLIEMFERTGEKINILREIDEFGVIISERDPNWSMIENSGNISFSCDVSVDTVDILTKAVKNSKLMQDENSDENKDEPDTDKNEPDTGTCENKEISLEEAIDSVLGDEVDDHPSMENKDGECISPDEFFKPENEEEKPENTDAEDAAFDKIPNDILDGLEDLPIPDKHEDSHDAVNESIETEKHEKKAKKRTTKKAKKNVKKSSSN